MRLQQLIRGSFILCSILTLLSLTTPLTFTHIWLRNIVYLLAVLLAFIVAASIRNSTPRNIIRWSLGCFSLLLIAISFFIGRLTGSWQTTSISHRLIQHHTTYIGQQMLDIGARGYARRIVKIAPITPFFNWITPIDTSTLNKKWMSVEESYNPFGWK